MEGKQSPKVGIQCSALVVQVNAAVGMESFTERGADNADTILLVF